MSVLTIDLSNADSIAGFQFTINGRGGIILGTCRGGDRATAAGIEFYQYLKDDSTLNIIMIAPVGLSLPAGEGAIAEIPFTLSETSGMDTARAFFTRVAICNAKAEYLDVSTTQVAWSTTKSASGQAARFTLEQNYPNPFNPSTTITYKLEEPANVRLVIFDIAGRQVNALVDQYQPAGRYSVKWNAAGNGRSILASGMYFARLQVDDQVAVEKMIVTK